MGAHMFLMLIVAAIGGTHSLLASMGPIAVLLAAAVLSALAYLALRTCRMTSWARFRAS